ncbi:MAG: hypothetical protein B7X60_02620 [Polynucleobacter sp. 39-45-136]|jgi:hypothetical protein|nr:MAG: hypothetical protein B7X60_02620 [Polynucleobacter sp. 39-45-136]
MGLKTLTLDLQMKKGCRSSVKVCRSSVKVEGKKEVKTVNMPKIKPQKPVCRSCKTGENQD